MAYNVHSRRCTGCVAIVSIGTTCEECLKRERERAVAKAGAHQRGQAKAKELITANPRIGELQREIEATYKRFLGIDYGTCDTAVHIFEAHPLAADLQPERVNIGGLEYIADPNMRRDQSPMIIPREMFKPRKACVWDETGRIDTAAPLPETPAGRFAAIQAWLRLGEEENGTPSAPLISQESARKLLEYPELPCVSCYEFDCKCGEP
jgi:hypothetical protein